MKRFLLITVIIALIFCIPLNIIAADSSGSFSWFCVHRRDHLQPASDPSFSFIDDYNGYYIDKNHGNDSEEKVIYLTFDAGYENGNIKKILDILKEENVHAAFFVLGHLIECNTDLVTNMFSDGHLVCNHTFSHKTMVGKSSEDFKLELTKLEETCVKKTGRELSKFYRPPEGKFDENSLRFADEMGYKTVFWSFAYADWDNNMQMSHEKAKQKILENIHNGEIMLLHPTSNTNAEILKDIIRELKGQGYRFGTLEEL